MSPSKLYRFILLAPIALTTYPAQSDDNHHMAKLLSDYVSAWNSHDPKKVLAFMAPKFEYYDPTIGKMTTGKQLLDFVRSFSTFSPDYQWTVLNKPVITKNAMAFEWTFAGTNTGTWGDAAPTGKKYVIYGASLIRFKDDRIIFEGDYWDQNAFQKQLGWIRISK